VSAWPGSGSAGVHSVLVEKRDIAAGHPAPTTGCCTAGRVTFAAIRRRRRVREESVLLKRLAGHCIEDAGGALVAVEGRDEAYVADFPSLCARCGIACTAISTPRPASWSRCCPSG